MDDNLTVTTLVGPLLAAKEHGTLVVLGCKYGFTVTGSVIDVVGGYVQILGSKNENTYIALVDLVCVTIAHR